MILSLLIVAAFNLYCVCLLPQIQLFDLMYFNILVLSVWFVCFLVDLIKKKRRDHQVRQSMNDKQLAASLFLPYIDEKIYRHDIKLLEEELASERRANDCLKDDIDRIVHELKARLGALALCKDQEMAQVTFETINRQLNSLLLLARVETNVMDLQFQKADLRSLINTSIKNNKYFLIHSRFSIQIDCPPIFVYTDPEWLIYVFDQLLINAIKYKCDPHIEITARKNEEETILSFTDHGIGIEAQDLSLIFEKGTTGSNVRSGTYRSTGMGLYFVRTVLEKLSGTIEVESIPGDFTTFTLHLFSNEKAEWRRNDPHL